MVEEKKYLVMRSKDITVDGFVSQLFSEFNGKVPLEVFKKMTIERFNYKIYEILDEREEGELIRAYKEDRYGVYLLGNGIVYKMESEAEGNNPFSHKNLRDLPKLREMYTAPELKQIIRIIQDSEQLKNLKSRVKK